MDPIDLAELQQFDVLQHVRPESLERLRTHATQRALERGASLLTANRPNGTLYLVRSGSFGVHLASPDAPPVAIIARGESIGELSVLDRRPTSAHVMAREPSVVLAVPEPEVWHLLEHSHSFAVNLLLKLGDRLRTQNRAISAQIRQREVDVELKAHHDSLTGTHNRRWLDAELPRRVDEHATSGAPLSVVLADIDRFKLYNDTFGHRIGDRVLKVTAGAMREALRQTDRIARYGGEEFLILLPDTDLERALATAERLRERVSRAAPLATERAAPPPVTVSMGVAQLRVGQTAGDLLDAADAALYEAKASGRNSVRPAKQEARREALGRDQRL